VNKDAARHATAREWWEQVLRADEPVGFTWSVLLGFLRLSTNPEVFPHPLDERTAVGKLDTWLSHPNVRVLREKDEHWDVLRSLIEEAGTAGNLTSDAHLAALAIGHGAVLVSFDADFGRWKGLRWSRPEALDSRSSSRRTTNR
jgi:toxin-antitoxin system PIN domain toxin